MEVTNFAGGKVIQVFRICCDLQTIDQIYVAVSNKVRPIPCSFKEVCIAFDFNKRKKHEDDLV